MNSLELATVYLAPKVIPLPPSKSLLIDTPPGWHPPILADGTHSSFLHIILLVRLAGFDPQASPSTYRLDPDLLARTGAALATPQVRRLV